MSISSRMLLVGVGERPRHRVAGEPDHVDAQLVDAAPHLLGVEASITTAVLPSNIERISPNCPAPCMNGAVCIMVMPDGASGLIFSTSAVGEVTFSFVKTSTPPPSA